MQFITTHRLTKRYGQVTALDSCTLETAQGEVFGLLGPNGAGKTTLLRLLMGFLRPSGGEAFIDGLDCHRASLEVHRRVAYLPGEARLFRRMRGADVLRFFSQVRPDSDLQRAHRLAERLDLDLSRQVARCSTGMRQKIALAAVLSIDAALVILDEPTSSLDPTTRREVSKLVRERKAAGHTVLFSSHVLSEVEEVCDRVALLRAGKLAHIQDMSHLRRRHRIRARLTGPFPGVPERLGDLDVKTNEDGSLQIETPGELSLLLSWLAELPLAEVQIEPLGLKAVYERFHREVAP